MRDPCPQRHSCAVTPPSVRGSHAEPTAAPESSGEGTVGSLLRLPPGPGPGPPAPSNTCSCPGMWNCDARRDSTWDRTHKPPAALGKQVTAWDRSRPATWGSRVGGLAHRVRGPETPETNFSAWPRQSGRTGAVIPLRLQNHSCTHHAAWVTGLCTTLVFCLENTN